jgi:hypothetical protein
MHFTSWLAAPVCAVAFVVAGSAGTAHADPGIDGANGQTERGPAHANSICSFSGLNDDPLAGHGEGGRVQSYGQIVRAGGKAFAPSPSMFCNGHRFPLQEGFPEE